MTPDPKDLGTTICGTGAGLYLLSQVNWQLVPYGELAKLISAFALIVIGWQMYKSTKKQNDNK